MTDTDRVLAEIDDTLDGYVTWNGLSADAMKWTSEPPARPSDSSWRALGYVAEDGFTLAASPDGQSLTACTMAELRAWGAGVVTDVETVEIYPGSGLTPGRSVTTWPPCLGCGGEVSSTPNALTIRTVLKNLTFHPCGCTLTVTDMPDGWRP